MKKRNFWYFKKKERRKLFWDMDGVLVNLEDAAEKIDPSIKDCVGIERNEKIRTVCDKIGFYENLPAYEGAVEIFKRLNEHFDTYLLSAPKWNNAHSYMEKRIWVEKHLGEAAYKKLILTHNKGIVGCRRDILVDDRVKYGVTDFPGEIILFGPNHGKFLNLEQVEEYLMKKYVRKFK